MNVIKITKCNKNKIGMKTIYAIEIITFTENTKLY